MRELDFILYKDKAQVKIFGFTNDDDTVYDMTGSTVNLLFYKTSTPEEIAGSITLLTGKISFTFTDTQTDTLGIYEYLVEETKQDLSKVILSKGNIVVKDYVPFSNSVESFLDTELPTNIKLEENYRNQRLTYWRRFLMDAFSITEANLEVESSWPIMANALLAKLIAYDALTLAAKGSLLQFMGGDFTKLTGQGGPIKKIETGPSNVEFYSVMDTIDKLLKPSPSGTTVLEMLSGDICGLAAKLKVKLPMCKDTSWVNPIVPQYYQNPDWAYPTLEEEVVSIGEDETE